MIESTIRVTETIIAFALVVLLISLLKRKKVVQVEDIRSFSKLLINAVLPAVILLELSTTPVTRSQTVLVMIMFIAGITSMILTWILGKIMRMRRETIGMLMITSTFGSSSLIGYPLIEFAFPGNSQAIADAILISEFGVGLPIFTLCPIIASWYGDSGSDRKSIITIVLNYFKSPVFISVVAGLIIAQFPSVVKYPLLDPFWEALRMIEGTLTMLACLVLGLQLRFSSPARLIPLFLFSATIQMVVQPLLASWLSGVMQVNLLNRQVLILISAMPSAVLGTVFATQFNCEGETASELVFLNILASLVGVPLVYYSIFH